MRGVEENLARRRGDRLEPPRPYRAAKALRDLSRTNPLLVVKGGALGKKSLSNADVQALAELPSREVLLGRLAGGMQAPVATLAGLLVANIRNLGSGLAQVRDQKAAAEGA